MVRWLLVLCLVAASLMGCSGRDSKHEPDQGQFAAGDVIRVLQEAGIQGTVSSEIPENVSAFGVRGYAIKVGSETLQVYVFANEGEQQRVTISSDGYAIGWGNRSTQVEWVAPPHFVRKANILVTFATNNDQLADQVRRAVEGLMMARGA
jgi:hypothetical protein